jgi:ribosome maturation factor RimP
MITEKRVEDILNDVLQGTDRFLVSLSVGKGNLINVFVDSDSNITIGECAKISRSIESELDREVEDFELRVSSPGLDHPFKLLRQYKKYVGREIAIVTKDDKKHSGVLVSVTEKYLELEEKKGKKGKEKVIVKYLFNDIKEGKPVISFKK